MSTINFLKNYSVEAICYLLNDVAREKECFGGGG